MGCDSGNVFSLLSSGLYGLGFWKQKTDLICVYIKLACLCFCLAFLQSRSFSCCYQHISSNRITELFFLKNIMALVPTFRTQKKHQEGFMFDSSSVEEIWASRPCFCVRTNAFPLSVNGYFSTFLYKATLNGCCSDRAKSYLCAWQALLVFLSSTCLASGISCQSSGCISTSQCLARGLQPGSEFTACQSTVRPTPPPEGLWWGEFGKEGIKNLMLGFGTEEIIRTDRTWS